MNCKDCKYFEESDNSCHRNPPIFMYGLIAQIEGITKEMTSHLSEGVWPGILEEENDWCGEFSPRGK